jgi:two-component system, NtrC family, sensor kinase
MLARCPFADKMRSREYRLKVILVMSIIVYLFAELGRIIGLVGGGLKISAAWPAAGVELALLLLYGFSIWPAILIGNILNYLHLVSLAGVHLGTALLVGFIDAIASTLQALVGAYIIRRYASQGAFNSPHDVIIFLFFGGIITCLIGCTISVPGFAIVGFIPSSLFAYTWLTYWIGDTIGVYLFTPVIIGFVVYKHFKWTWNKIFEFSVISILLVCVLYLVFAKEYPLLHLFLPLFIWTAFRFRIQETTAILLVTALIAIIATFQGHGPFIGFVKGTLNQSLLFLIIFVQMISATTLILIGTLNEREDAWNLLKDYSTDLEQTVNLRTQQLNDVQEEIVVKEKLASLGALTTGISHKIKDPLIHIHDLTETGKEHLNTIETAVKQEKAFGEASGEYTVGNALDILKDCFQKIGDSEKQASNIIDTLLRHTQREKRSGLGARPINLHTLLNSCLNKAMETFEFQDSLFPLKINKDYDKNVGMVTAIPEDLEQVFINIIDNSLYALTQKIHQQGELFEPILNVTTRNLPDNTEIIIRDNGIGIPETVVRKIFQPFFSTKPIGEATGLGLTISRDIIVHEHRGTIQATSEKGVFTEVVINLPKALESAIAYT